MKRFISVLLAFSMIFTCAVPAFAKSEGVPSKVPESSPYPFVLVRGMDFNGLRYKMGTDEEENAFAGIDAGKLIGTVFKAIGSGIIHHSWNSFADVVCEYVESILGHMACDEKGNSKYDVTVKQYPLALSNYRDFDDLGDWDEMGLLKKAVELYGADNVYYYNYDWRLDPLMHADNINALVNQALSDHPEAEKVNLLCASMGGIETVSYLYKYGCEKLNKIVFLSSTITGTHVTTDLLSGKVEITSSWLNIYLQQLVSDNKPLKNFINVLYKIKLMDGVCNLANNVIIPNIKKEVYDVFLRDTFGTMPALWALVLPEGYDECISFMFNGTGDKYKDLIALTKEYQKMAAQRDDMLRQMEADGLSILLVAGYNSSCIPVYTGGGCNGDTILESDRMLGKAVVAPIGTDLGKDYVAKNPDKLSPDRIVDLSSVLFPENTWAINGAKHVGCNYGSDMSTFVFTLVNAEGKADIHTFEIYPQFMASTTGTDIVYIK